MKIVYEAMFQFPMSEMLHVLQETVDLFVTQLDTHENNAIGTKSLIKEIYDQTWYT